MRQAANQLVPIELRHEKSSRAENTMEHNGTQPHGQGSSGMPLQKLWESGKEEFFQTGDADRLLARRTAQVDDLIEQAYQDLPASSPGLALLAVGGYGRKQLFPYSDIDLLVLFSNEKAVENSKELLSPFFQRLWDEGLHLSQSVRTPAECTEVHDRNIELNVSLLDVRFLTGDAGLSAKLTEKLAPFVHGQRQNLVRNLAQLTAERHGKYNNTIYHLEPNIKETPGGLRDYQVLCWLSQIKNSSAARLGVADSFDELQTARKFLFSLRCYLHYKAARDANVLTFDAQESVSELAGKRDPAEWMREYFRNARDLYRSATRMMEASESQSSSLFSQFRDWRSRLSNSEFTVLRERVYFKAPQQLEREPDLILRCYEFIARHGIRLSLDAERRIAAARATLENHFVESRPIWPALSQIFSLPHVDIALDSMHETGVLKIIFPEQAEIDCLVIRDFYHRYTVDEHSLTAIRIVRRLSGTKDGAAKPYADLLSELENPAQLFFAFLFHDVGKGTPDEGHVDASLRICEAPMERIQMPAKDREMVRFLIERHLVLSSTLNSRDLEDRATIESLAERLGTVERLKALTLLTYGDISAVNPGAMTPWRGAQLWRLYLLAYNELTRALDAERIESLPAGSPERAAFLEGFPTRYLRTHTEKEIDEHLRLEKQAFKSGGIAVDCRKLEGVYRVTLLAEDRPFLFASIAGTLSSFGMNILKAEAFANRRGIVLDTFSFADPSRTLELNPTEVERLISTLERVASGKIDVRNLLGNRPKPTLPSKGAGLKPAVSFDSAGSSSATLIQIVAEDRPGLLYDLAGSMSAEGCNIEVVLIDTEAHKAIDVFYVTAGGQKLDAAKQESLERALLQACSG